MSYACFKRRTFHVPNPIIICIGFGTYKIWPFGTFDWRYSRIRIHELSQEVSLEKIKNLEPTKI